MKSHAKFFGFSEKWGDYGYAMRGALNAKETPKPVSDPYPWLKMIPIKRYKTFTRFYKRTANGDGYFECFPNYEIDAEKRKRGIE